MECRNRRQSVSVSNSIRFNNMKSLVLFVVLLIVAFGKSDALITCSCSNCTSGDTCQGEICYSRVIIGKSPGEDPVYKQGCYFNPQANLCNTSTDWHTTLCCETHLCNVDLDPMLTSGDSSTSSADYTFSTDIFSSTDDGGSTNLEPTVSVSTPPPPPSASVPPSDGNCYQSDSSSGDPTEVHLCTLQTFCFSTLRRKSDGTVVYKRGCSRTCTEETRNRKIKRCCSHSLCNLRIQDPLEENGSGTTTATPLTPETTTPIPLPPPSPLPLHSHPLPLPPPSPLWSPTGPRYWNHVHQRLLCQRAPLQPHPLLLVVVAVATTNQI